METDADECAAWAANAPMTEGVLTPFGVLDPARLSQDGCIDALLGLERTIAWAQAQQARIMAEAAAHPEPVPAPRRDGADYALLSLAHELACALRWSTDTAMSRLAQARGLVGRLDRTLQLFEAGSISAAHVRTLLDGVRDLDDTLAAQVEARVLAKATQQTPAEFRRSVRAAVATVDPVGDQERCAAAAERRRIAHEPAEDGMAWINAYLPAADAQTVMTGVQAVADKARKEHPDDERTVDQLRADALTAICSGVLTGSMPTGVASWQGRRPHVSVSVALSTLLGYDEQPGDLDGYGPVPADLARRMAADPTATWRRLVTDELGHVRDYGRTVYRPPADLRELVIARDRICRGVGCHRSARHCEQDHIVAWADGGATDRANLAPECTRDHHIRHDCGWAVHRAHDGTVTWTSPSGRRYDKPAETHPVDRTRPRPDDSQDDSDPPPF